jgi:hypothetical protein
VISPDLYGVAGTFKVMSPLFKSSDDYEHLGVKGNGVLGIIFVRLLGEYDPSGNARAISLESK